MEGAQTEAHRLRMELDRAEESLNRSLDKVAALMRRYPAGCWERIHQEYPRIPYRIFHEH
jgi:hypothetical protein